MPPGAFVVESGVYKVGADRDWERSEPIYWKQVVFGARNGSDGSGTMPRRRVGRLVEEDIQRLRAMEQPTKLITQANLELKRQSGSTARLRASSPIAEQNAPLIEFASPGSEISTVPHPNSAEHPSTLLTNSTRGFSSISSPNFDGTSSSRTRGLNTNKSSTLGTEVTQLGTIHEQSVSYAEMSFPGPPVGHHQQGLLQPPLQPQFVGGAGPPGYPPNPNFATVRADVHTRPVFNNRKDDLYWQRSTYRNADVMFPNYALNYPAPIHHLQYQGNISPSIQYPETVMPKYREEALMYQLAAMQTTPLATSSPPIGHHPGGVQQEQQSAAQLPPNDLGLPFKTSTRTSLHDYENMRYPVKRRRSNHSSAATSRPPSDEFGRLNRESSVIDGELLKRPPTSTSTDGRASSSADGRASSQQVRSISASQPDAVSLVSEVLDAEVTALTNSSPGSSNGSTERKSSSSASKAAQRNLALLQQARKNLTEELSAQETRSSSSGIASKNSSQNQNNQTTSSSGSSSSTGVAGASSSSLLPLLSIDTSSNANKNTVGLEPIPESSSQHTYVYYDNLPFYENWPPPKQYPPPVRPRLSLQQQQHAYLGYQFVPPPEAASAQLIPPLTPHQSMGQVARPQHPSSSSAAGDRKNDSPGVVDTSLDTPPSNPGAGQGSRPGSAHSAPLLDLSIDRHYEFDSARTPTDDIGIHHLQQANQPILLLPQNWNRPYLGYNPRRDRELGAAAAAAKQDRVFSDSEIYSPVFPRGRPEPRVDITARVQAMKKEFAEYRIQQQQQQQLQRSSGGNGNKPSPPLPLISAGGEPLKGPKEVVPEGTHLSGRMPSPLKNPEKLESLI